MGHIKEQWHKFIMHAYLFFTTDMKKFENFESNGIMPCDILENLVWQ
jgi:hypothetical protein